MNQGYNPSSDTNNNKQRRFSKSKLEYSNLEMCSRFSNNICGPRIEKRDNIRSNAKCMTDDEYYNEDFEETPRTLINSGSTSVSSSGKNFSSKELCFEDANDFQNKFIGKNPDFKLNLDALYNKEERSSHLTAKFESKRDEDESYKTSPKTQGIN